MGSLAPGNYRLTNDHRDRICKAMLQHKYIKSSDAYKSIRADVASLATAVYNSVLDKKKRELITSLPKGWVEEREHIKVRIGHFHRYQNLHFNGDFVCLNGTYSFWTDLGMYDRRSRVEEIKRPIPYSLSNVFVQLDNTDDLAVRLEDTVNKLTKVNSEVSAVSASLKATLKTITTTKRLIEVWPESKPFVDAIFGQPSAVKVESTALVLPINDLNAKLGLPVPEVA
jgi:hypothetical protein